MQIYVYSHNLINMHFYLLSHPPRTILHGNQIIVKIPTLHGTYSLLVFYILVGVTVNDVGVVFYQR
jgi:hypothetical protein